MSRDQDLTEEQVHAAFDELRLSMLDELHPRGSAAARRSLRHRRRATTLGAAVSIVGLTVGAVVIANPLARTPVAPPNAATSGATAPATPTTPDPNDPPFTKDLLPRKAWLVGSAASAHSPVDSANVVERAGTYRYEVTCRGTGTGTIRLDVSPGFYKLPDGVDASRQVACGVPPVTTSLDVTAPAGTNTINVYVAWDPGTTMQNDVNGYAWKMVNGATQLGEYFTPAN
ncbi:hypothetical protein [Asanoa ishikariensis]|nr:hypothetical protein [Asanoa ishikariensis]